MWASSLAPLALDLVQQGNVFIKVDKAHERDELVHYWLYLDLSFGDLTLRSLLRRGKYAALNLY